jgi:DNA-binding MarR family transcriptional regulator
VTNTPRDELLRRAFARQGADDAATVGPSDGSELPDVAPIIEGLVFAGRPIDQATQSVTSQYDLGPRGCYILSAINSGITYPLELASLLRIGRSLVTAELNRLSAAGLITSAPGKDDRRRSELSLTATGRRASAEVSKRLDQTIRGNLAGYTDEEVRLFSRMLADVSKVSERSTP